MRPGATGQAPCRPSNTDQRAKLQINGVPTNSSGYLPRVCELPVPHESPANSLWVAQDLTIGLATGLGQVINSPSVQAVAKNHALLLLSTPGWRALPSLDVGQMAVTPDGQTLFAVGATGLFRRSAALGDDSWDPVTASENLATAFVLSPGGRTIYVGNDIGEIFSLHVDRAGAATPLGTPAKGSGITCLAVTPDGKTLYASTAGGQICAQRVANGTGAAWLSLAALGAPAGFVTSMIVTPDGKFLVVGSSGGGVHRRLIASVADLAWTLLCKTTDGASVTTLAMSPDGVTVFGNTPSATFFITRIEDETHKLESLYSPTTTLVIARDGQTLILGTPTTGVIFEELVDCEEDRWAFQNWVRLDRPIQSLAVTTDGRTLFAGTLDGNVFRLNIGSPALTTDGRTVFGSTSGDKNVIGVPSPWGSLELAIVPTDGDVVLQTLTTNVTQSVAFHPGTGSPTNDPCYQAKSN